MTIRELLLIRSVPKKHLKELLKLSCDSCQTRMGLNDLSLEEYNNSPIIIALRQIDRLSDKDKQIIAVLDHSPMLRLKLKILLGK